MMLYVFVPLCALFMLSHQATSAGNCMCVLKNSEPEFPHDKLSAVEDSALECTNEITNRRILELDSLLLGLDRRIPQLQEDVLMLERDDAKDLYGAISLQIIENEMKDITKLIDKLNSSAVRDEHLANGVTKQLEDAKAVMQDLEKFDTMQVVRNQEANQRLKRELKECNNGHLIIQPTQPPHGNCPHGQFVNISGPRMSTVGEYPGSYNYGAWGRDPQPEVGKEKWYWVVMMTASNRYSNYVRQYSSLSSLIVGVSVPGNVLIHTSNPTTNTIQGPNVVMYEGALYYNCYNQDELCRFNLAKKTVTKLQLPKGIRYNSKGMFCHPDECYPYTDMDLATDESGVWLIYTTTQDYGNLVLSKVEYNESMTLNETWHTSVYKNAVTNTFMACGVLYATRYVNKETEEIFYSMDTMTGEEKFNIGIFLKKISPNIYSLNYSPVDQMLHAYSDSKLVSYAVEFK